MAKITHEAELAALRRRELVKEEQEEKAEAKEVGVASFEVSGVREFLVSPNRGQVFSEGENITGKKKEDASAFEEASG